VGLDRYVIPGYIDDPNVGILFGRARGPFLESGANGLAMFMCAVAAAIGFATWRSRAARIGCASVVALCLVGSVFTLTRAVWIAVIVGSIVGLLWLPATRRYLLPALAVGAVAVVALLQVVPGLRNDVNTRVQDDQSVWDRYNTNRAALAMVEARPLFGFGWQTFQTDGPSYMTQAADYPLTGAGLEVHNVFLSHAAELGLVGSLLWLSSFLGAIGGAIGRRGPPELAPWRAGLAAITAAFLVSANLSPLSAAFPNLVLWLWAGIVARDHFLEVVGPRRGAGAERDLPAAAVSELTA
jgi:O-antigen ligase